MAKGCLSLMVEFNWEPMQVLRRDGLERLAQEAWLEVEGEKEKFPLDMAWSRYQSMEDSGSMRFLSARIDGVLVGYAAVVMLPHLRSQQVMMAQVLDIFVSKEARSKGVGLRLINMLEDWMKRLGAGCLVVSERDEVKTGKLFKRLGYKSNERIWAKSMGSA